MFEPVVKWSGSKRSQADTILNYFPRSIDTYYEPFCGGCSVLRKLLASDIKCKHYICSDINADLINLFNSIKDTPKQLFEHYENLWKQLNADDDLERKKQFFYSIRQRYNEEHRCYDFMFIMRTTTNGMPRYNSNGQFNNSFHVTRNGIVPKTLEKIIKEWSNVLNSYNVQFINCSYDSIYSRENDVIYCDPPYANTKGMYFGNIDNSHLWDWLRKQKGYYLLSYDGISGDSDNTYQVPTDVYSEHKYLVNGKSSFKRIIGNKIDSLVKESLYLK